MATSLFLKSNLAIHNHIGFFSFKFVYIMSCLYCFFVFEELKRLTLSICLNTNCHCYHFVHYEYFSFDSLSTFKINENCYCIYMDVCTSSIKYVCSNIIIVYLKHYLSHISKKTIISIIKFYSCKTISCHVTVL